MAVAVDDNALVLGGTVSVLEDLSHTVWVAISGQQAFDVVMRASDVALVIANQVMPRTGGGERVRKLKGARPHIAAIPATSLTEIPPRLDAIALRWPQPFDRDQSVDGI